MGYVTKTSNGGQRLAAVSNAIGQLSSIPSQMAEAKQKAEEFKQKQVMAQYQLEDAQQKSQLLWGKKLNDTISDGFHTEDTKGWWDLHEKDVNDMVVKAGIKSSPEEIKKLITMKDQEISTAMKDMSAGSNFLITATPATTPRDQWDMANKKAVAGFDTMIKKMPSSLAGDYKAAKDKYIAQSQSVQEAYNKWDLEKEKAKNAVKVAEAKPGPQNPFQKTLGSDSAKDFRKSVDNLPRMQGRISKIDSALALVGDKKVMTGPISGTKLLQFAQKVKSPAAQQLAYYLSSEGVNAIMDFAKEAGVRSIDTEQERQYLLNSIASEKMSPEVMKEALGRIRSAIVASIGETKNKQKWLQSHPDLNDYYAQAGGDSGQLPGGGPAAGDVVDGYKFIGGNPADQKSWQKVQ